FRGSKLQFKSLSKHLNNLLLPLLRSLFKHPAALASNNYLVSRFYQLRHPYSFSHTATDPLQDPLRKSIDGTLDLSSLRDQPSPLTLQILNHCSGSCVERGGDLCHSKTLSLSAACAA